MRPRRPFGRPCGESPSGRSGCVDQCYQNGRYWTIDYRADPVPPLDPADAAWADRLLRAKGLR